MIPELSPVVNVYSNEKDLTEVILKYTNRVFLEEQQLEAVRISRMYFSKKPIMKNFIKQLVIEEPVPLETTQVNTE